MENAIETTPGARIRAARRAVGMSQSDLAAATGLSLDSIQNWEANRYRPKWDQIVMLCDALEVSADELLGLKGEKP